MIKTKKCSLCNNNAFSKGFCQSHQSKKGIKQSRRQTSENKKERSEKRNSYFEYHLEKCNSSEESFKEISEPTRANICHIFDKSRHPSLQDNLDNCIYLSLNEHQDFDRLLYNHQFSRLEVEFKNSFNKTCIIANKLLPLCKESTVFTRELIKYLDGREIKSQ
jgi:hypothetical protein